MYRIIPGWPQTELAPASWQPCSLARVGHFGGVLRLRSSAWDRPRTPSRTSAAAGLAWLVGRFAGAHRTYETDVAARKPRAEYTRGLTIVGEAWDYMGNLTEVVYSISFVY